MSKAIIDEQEKEKDKYQFLEDEDDFEEFEYDIDAQEELLQIDDILQTQKENKLWKQDWDDEEADDDFAKNLKQQLQAR